MGRHAYDNCTALTEATTGAGITTIEDYTFYNCENLATVVVGSSVQNIDDYAFYNTAVTSVTLPRTVKRIGNHAFEKCDALTTVRTYSGVETIGDYAFSEASALYRFNIPTTVNTIGEYAFNKCSALTTVTIPDAVTRIENSTFNRCTSLADVTLNNKITYIGKNAFAGATISEITFPKTLLIIEEAAFEDCANLVDIVIPDATTKIGQSAFSGCTSMSTLSVADKLGLIGVSAFADTNDLAVTIRYASGEITDKLFAAQNFASVVIEEGITKIGDYTFFSCKELAEIEFPESLLEIGDYSFAYNIAYPEITFPDALETIGNNAFAYSINLRTVSIPDTVSTTGVELFENCEDITLIFRNVTSEIVSEIMKDQNIVHLVVEDGIETISDAAFKNTVLIDATIPDTVSTIGHETFLSTNPITLTIRKVNGNVVGNFMKTTVSLNKTGSVVNVIVNEGITEIGISAFHNSTIESVVFEGDVDCIGRSAFDNCLKLINVEFKGDLGTIGQYAFNTCKLLPKMELPDTVTSIGAYAFYDCNSMVSINLPVLIDIVNNHTFYGCASLKTVVIPEDVTEIGDYAYYGCTSIDSVVTNDKCTRFGDYAFYNCNLLKDIELNDELTELGAYVFGYTGLKSVEMPDSITRLGNSAFYACTALESARISQNVTNIENNVFYGCVALLKAYLSDNTESIADEAFYGCDNVTLYADNNDVVKEYADYNWYKYCDTSADFTLSIIPPTKTTYMWGEELNLSGLEVALTNSEGETVEITGYEVTGYDNTVLGEQTLTVTYKEQTKTFKITVIERTCGTDDTVDHIWDEGVITSEPTITEVGITTYTCLACSSTREEEIPMLPNTHEHSYGEWEQYDDETHIHECDCGQTQFEDHSWDDGEVTTEPTHTTTGVRTYTCSVCKGTKTEDVDTVEGHEFGDWTEVDEETHTRECACGETETEEHTWNNGVVTTPATSTTTGIKTFTCTGCLTTKEEIIDMITDTHEHSYGEWVSVDEENHIRTCECGEEEIASHEMDEEGEVVKEPTHFESGERVYKCKYCDYSISEEIEATDVHEFGKWKYIDVETHSRTCDCGEVETVEHSWDDGVVTTKPTLTATGIKTFTCSDCKGTKEVIIAVIEPSGRLVVGNVTGKAGDTVEVKVTLSDNEGIAGMVLNLTYDEELTLVEAVQGDALPNMAFTAPGDYSKNPVNLVWDAMEADASNGHIVTLKFQISEDAEERDYEVNLSYKPGAICDNDMNDVDFTITNGVITVKNYTPGDVNGDGEVDVKDIIILRRFIAGGYEITYVEAAVDINRDGSNDAKDIITLRRFVADGYGIILK